jgi:simple sugar transport system ATP-binding protein
MAEAAALTVAELVAGYGGVTVLEAVSLTARPGTITAVLGANGAGKTTLLRTISGLVRPRQGRILIDGANLARRRPEDITRAGVAHVPEGQGVITELTVEENLRLGGLVRRGAERAAALADAYQRFPLLAERKRRLAGTLSGGERQCVAISRAVYFGAKVLILDEPTAALGVKQSGVVLKYIIQARERGLGVIFITHNPHHAYPVGDRFLLLNRGRSIGYYEKSQVTREELTGLMAGGGELEALSHELEAAGGAAAGVAAALGAGAEELGVAQPADGHPPNAPRAPNTPNSPA